MTTRLAAAPLLALLAACATTAGSSRSAGLLQADSRDPARAEEVDPSEGSEASSAKEALAHLDRAQRARQSGNDDQAAAEYKASADLFVAFADKYPANRYRLVFLRMASQAYLDGRDADSAARVAQRLGSDPQSSDVSKAVAARLLATADQQIAIREMRAGKIPPLQLVGFEARKGAELRPQPLPAPWKTFVDAVDGYARLAAAPAAAAAGAGAELPPLQLVAAQVQFGYDNMEDARRRFWALIQQAPGQAEVMESTVPYYLETYRVEKDDPGYDEALARVQPVMAAQAKKAREVADLPGATEPQKKAAAVFAKLDDDLTRRLRGADYSAASALLRKGEAAEKAGKAAEGLARYKEAAALFEKFAAENRDSPDAPNALYNAAVAWDKAKDNKKAIAEREKLVATYPDAKIVPQALVRLGVGMALEGNNAGAAKSYETYLSRWPDGPQHCIALQNLGVALQTLGKRAEASQRYEQFAADPSCVKEDPNNAARVLYEAGKLLVEAKRPQDAKRIFQDLVDLQGVSGTPEKAYQADARDRLARMK
ncbi:MAG TPA: tetratricopeptide repeat protein [Anaeromyxobacteraceae bacterium]|nr:tetratricopeptide repeat protein [Anaeromyxobacteraceae bacterium]